MITCFLSTAYALEYEQHGKKQIFDSPIREMGVIVTENGYYPKNIVLFEKERVRLFITSTLDYPTCFTMPERNIFLSVNKGEMIEIEAYFANGGEFEFYCPTDKIRGQFTVLKKKRQINKNKKRSIASTKIKVWMPKN